MRVRLSASLIVLCAVAGGCAPETKCSGEQIYDSVAELCRVCPMTATFKNGTCKCKDSYEFVNMRCVLMDGAMIETPDSGSDDSGTGSSASVACTEYCDFAKSCLGDNTLAQSALPDIVMGLHADSVAACTSNCKKVLGGEGSGDPTIACIEAGREAAACDGDTSQVGLAGAMMLVGDCCRPRQDNALCKSICEPLKANSITASMNDFCK